MMKEDKYKKIKYKEDYDKLLSTGLFFEIFPELIGEWKDDMMVIYNMFNVKTIS